MRLLPNHYDKSRSCALRCERSWKYSEGTLGLGLGRGLQDSQTRLLFPGGCERHCDGPSGQALGASGFLCFFSSTAILLSHGFSRYFSRPLLITTMRLTPLPTPVPLPTSPTFHSRSIKQGCCEGREVNMCKGFI